jgi:hypothetical protein
MNEDTYARIVVSVGAALMIELEVKDRSLPADSDRDIRTRVDAASRIYAAMLIAESQPPAPPAA